MKLWKSPVLYLGVVLLLAVVAAQAAPYVVDWNQYRASIESYGRKLTGREVKIHGPIAVRLFPWPKLVIDDVTVANPPAAADAHLLTAERIDVRVTLAGLFNGEIRVEAIDVIRPVVSIERMAAGSWTWQIEPTAAIANSRLLEHVKLDRVRLVEGAVWLIDGRRGGRAEIRNADMTLSAPGIAGPWRMQGVGTLRDKPLEIAVTTGAWQADAPLKLGVRVSPGNVAGLIYDFDGQYGAGGVAGELRIAQAATTGGKSDAEGAFRPLVLIAKVKSGFDEIAMTEIAIAPRDEEKTGNLLSGDAHIRLGAVIGVSANLTASKFNLDTVAGAKAKALLRQGGGLAVVADLLASLPKDIDGKGTLKVTSLIAGGEKLQNVVLSAALSEDALRIDKLSAALPGQTQAQFEGTLFVGERGPQLAGDLALESLDFRSLVAWAWPERKDALLRMWSGSRGRLKLATGVDVTPERLSLADGAYQIDDAMGKASFTYSTAEVPSADLKLDATLIDIDSFIPDGIAAFSPAGGASLADGLAAVPILTGPAHVGLSFKAGRLLLNGVEAKNAVVDVSLTPRGLDLKAVEIGDVGGASLAVSGLVSRASGALDGSVSAHVKAKQPDGLLKLLGLARGGARPAWFEPLGETDLVIAANFIPGGERPGASLDISGRSGKLQVSSAFEMMGLDWRNAALKGSASIKSDLSLSLLELAGLRPVVANESPGNVSVKATGSLSEGLEADVQAELYGALLQFQGKIKNAGPAIEAAGRIGVSAERSRALFGALGLAADDVVFSAESRAAYQNGRVVLSDLSGIVSGSAFDGHLAVDAGARLTGSLDVARIALMPLLGQIFLPWNGKPADAEAPFAEALPLGLTGELWINPKTLSVFEGFDIPDSQIGIAATGRDIEVEIFGKTGSGDSVALGLKGKAVPGGRSFEGKVTLPVDLASRLRTADGNPALAGLLSIEGGFKGFGRSPASVLSSLDGSGSYKLRSASLRRFEPHAFASRIAAAKTQDDVDAALAALVSGGDLSLADTVGSFTMQDGVAAFLPMRLETEAADATIIPVAELAVGQVDIGIGLQFKQPPGMPAMEVAYAGPPMALSRSVDASALQARLGMDVLKRGVDELERLQKEQERLAIDEEKARAEDAARLEAYEDKRRELRQRQRELFVHKRMRAEQARRAKEDARKAPVAKDEPAPPPPRRKDRPKPAPEEAPEPSIGPVVIVPPADPPPAAESKPKTLLEFLNSL